MCGQSRSRPPAWCPQRRKRWASRQWARTLECVPVAGWRGERSGAGSAGAPIASGVLGVHATSTAKPRPAMGATTALFLDGDRERTMREPPCLVLSADHPGRRVLVGVGAGLIARRRLSDDTPAVTSALPRRSRVGSSERRRCCGRDGPPEGARRSSNVQPFFRLGCHPRRGGLQLFAPGGDLPRRRAK